MHTHPPPHTHTPCTQVLTDYAWERKDEATGEVVKDRVPTVKRSSLTALPPHLIVHLKRFAFDLETMQQNKLNDRLEFPAELDMWSYSLDGRPRMEGETDADREARREWRRKQGLEREEEAAGARARARGRDHYRYRLAGVVVHMGTSNSGHYYSYIRERDGSGRGWFEFNDTVVAEFDPADLEMECFGGQETGGSGGYRGNWTRERIRNAFLLIYDRCDVDEGSTAASAAAGAAGVPARAAEAERPRVPPAIMEEIMRENVEFWRKTHILTKHYFEFMEQLLEPVYRPTVEERELQADDPDHRALLEAGLRLATRFALGTLVEAKDWDGLAAWSRRLQVAYQRSPGARAWFLALLARDSAATEAAGPGGLLWDLLLETEERRGRVAVLELVDGVAHAALEPPAPEDKEGEDEGMALPVAACAASMAAAEALCLDLVRALLALRRRVRETKGGAARADGYLYLLGRLLRRMGSARALVLEELSGEDCFLDLLALADEAVAHARQEAQDAPVPLPAAAATAGDSCSAVEGGGDRLEGYAIVGDLLTSLLRACVVPGAANGGEPEEGEGAENGGGGVPARPEPLPPAHVLTAAEEEVMCSPAFAARLVALVSTPQAKGRLRGLFEHWLWDNAARTEDVLQAIEQGIAGEWAALGAGAGENAVVGGGSSNGGGRLEALKPCFRALMLLVAVPDRLQAKRVNVAMRRTLVALEAQSCYKRATELGLAMLMRLARESPHVRAWFQQGANLRPLTPPAGAGGGAGADGQQQQPVGAAASSSSSSKKAQHQPTRSASSTALSSLVHRITGGTMGTSAAAAAAAASATPTNGGGSLSAASSPRSGWGGPQHPQHPQPDGGNEPVSRPEVRWAEEWLVTHQPSAAAGSSGGGGAAESFWGGGKSTAAASSSSSSSSSSAGRDGGKQEVLMQRLLEGVRGLARGAYDVLDYDSDMDGRAIVGRRIQVRWNAAEWYTGACGRACVQCVLIWGGFGKAFFNFFFFLAD
jgi:hypothetical protein